MAKIWPMSNSPPQFPRYQTRRTILKWATAAAFKLLSRMTVIGRENIPSQGPIIVVANHFNFADPAILVHLLPWQTEYIAGTVRPTSPNALVTALPELWVTINVHRGAASTQALRQASQVLKQNGILGIFPEAGAWAQVLRPARPGTAFLAATSGATLLPIGIDGMDQLFPAVKNGRRGQITVRIGRPFGPFKVTGRGPAKKAALEEIGHTIMRKIGALLPPEKQGVYSANPAIRQAAEAVAAYPFDS